MATQQNIAAREKRRRSNGEFGTQPLDEASIGPDGVDLRATRDRAIEQIDGSDIAAGDLLMVDGEDRVVDRAYPISSPEDGRHGGEWIVEFESYDREPDGSPSAYLSRSFERDHTFTRVRDTRPAYERLDYAPADGESSLQSHEPLGRLTIAQTLNRSAHEVAREATSGLYDLNPPYQRGSVWDLRQRQRLIESFCRGIPVPAVTVNDRTTSLWRCSGGSDPLSTGLGMRAVIDGKQRIETCQQWFNDEFAVPASWFDPERVERTFETSDGPYVAFSGLSQGERNRWSLTKAHLVVNEAQVATVEDEARLYLLLNGGGTDQSGDDMKRAAEVAARAE
ncbi:DUF262 domain-containing protein [Nocardioides sp. Leaf285]|uniref:DUF262 domain-containing protein n=1 Tax=Nocardioides sp. Leaf285 TaxID=1736322 RepID=UPI0007025578|nr:DUF262 domain-containing protein [Nocardioides sp. Leaf285]KQP62896.1 hypothetical protein ASF47_17950 [Nocardioides sp. Leaf285]